MTSLWWVLLAGLLIIGVAESDQGKWAGFVLACAAGLGLVVGYLGLIPAIA